MPPKIADKAVDNNNNQNSLTRCQWGLRYTDQDKRNKVERQHMEQIAHDTNIFIFVDPIFIDQEFKGIENWLANENWNYPRQKSIERKKQKWADGSKNNPD